jgi:putative transposase
MKAHTQEFPVEKMSEVFGVSRSGYYRWLKAGQVESCGKEELKAQIKAAFAKSKRTYGSPRIAEQLKKEGVFVSKSTVARRMKAMKIRARKPKRFISTTDSKHDYLVAANHLNRDFDAKEPGQKWVSDITYVRVNTSWYYLTVVIDLADRAVVGWCLSDSMAAEHTSIEALKKAIQNRMPAEGCLFHSDRGVQYACNDFTEQLGQSKAQQSMSRKGNCWDNAVAESFFKTIKTECIYQHSFINYKQAYSTIFNYIDGWYNTLRIHSALEGRSPAEAFQMMTTQKLACRT